MKKSILIAAAFGLIVAGNALAQNGADVDNSTGSGSAAAGSGIVGTKHDLSLLTGIGLKYPTTDPLDRICIFCHAPHHSMQEADAAGIKYLPLWNHAVTAQFYTPYESDFGDGPDTDASTGASTTFVNRHLFNGRDSQGEPGSVSRLCLSCHDGSVAVNQYGNSPQRSYSQQNGTDLIRDQWKIGGGGNLVNHHPIGFDYQSVVDADDEIAPIDTVLVTGTSHNTTTIGSLLYAGKMECVTCHDVHNTKNTGETFLWKSNYHSDFCMTCHLKR